jgi:hypothetical protein
MAAIQLDELHTLRKETSRLSEIETQRASLGPHWSGRRRTRHKSSGVVTPVLRQGFQSERPLELGERFGLELPFVTQAGHNDGQIIFFAL